MSALLFLALITPTFGCIPTKPPNPVLSENLFPRVVPVGAYEGLDQCSILRYYNNEPCPTNGDIVCHVAPMTDATTAYLQLLKGTTVIFAGRDAESIDIFVTCVNGFWEYNGQRFDSVSCSQS
ncbi:unnamed protein product, partial [Mesorhabditis belari]|uniref:Uncharacterized protein n=1 Tax=Mesorhabditis belari TaxID=2138241 RepID=A0AAF3FFV4_9BILA